MHTPQSISTLAFAQGNADGMWLGSPQSGLLAPYRQLGSVAPAASSTGQPHGFNYAFM